MGRVGGWGLRRTRRDLYQVPDGARAHARLMFIEQAFVSYQVLFDALTFCQRYVNH